MTMTMEKENRPVGRIIAVVLIALLGAGVLTFGWGVFLAPQDEEPATRPAGEPKG